MIPERLSGARGVVAAISLAPVAKIPGAIVGSRIAERGPSSRFACDGVRSPTCRTRVIRLHGNRAPRVRRAGLARCRAEHARSQQKGQPLIRPTYPLRKE